MVPHTENLKSVVVKYIDAYNRFDIPMILECMTENCVFENVSNSGNAVVCHGRSKIEKLAKQSMIVFSDRKQTIKNWIIGDNRVAVEIDYFGKIAMDLPNGFKAGQELKLRGMSVFEFEGLKIKRLADYS